MGKSVYSLVLMDEVVEAIDRLAGRAGTSRSSMVNRILADYAGLSTPAHRAADVFGCITALLEQLDGDLQYQEAKEAQLLLRSPMRYKYNPTLRYGVELYPHPTRQAFGELRVQLRTQNAALLGCFDDFLRLWCGWEEAAGGAPLTVAIGVGQYRRGLRTSPELLSMDADLLAARITAYLQCFDQSLAAYFAALPTPQAGERAGKIYHSSRKRFADL